jgi:kynurenine formamidase
MNGSLIASIRRGISIFDLAQPLHQRSPCPGSHPGFRLSLMRRHGDFVRSDGVTSANEIMMMGGHSGTHVDSLSHVACNGYLFGGIEAKAVQSALGFSCLGVDTMEPVFARGILLDICGLRQCDRLPHGYPISKGELSEAEKKANVKIENGDVVLIRTGWAQLWDKPDIFIADGIGIPGPTEEAARWLADKGIRMTGSDTHVYEHREGSPTDLPVHRLLIVERGIHIVEMLNLEQLAAAEQSEFAFALAPLKIVGATGSPVRPFAIVEQSRANQ